MIGLLNVKTLFYRTTVAMEGLQYNNLAQKFSVASWEVHPDFVQGIIINYDYSVITLTSAVTLKPGVVSACFKLSVSNLSRRT